MRINLKKSNQLGSSHKMQTNTKNLPNNLIFYIA